MPFQKGHKLSVGNKGGGRKTIREEVKEFRDAQSLFFEDQDQEKIETKVRSGKFSVKDRFILTAMEGDSRILSSLAKKALPDVLKVEHEGEVKHIISIDE